MSLELAVVIVSWNTRDLTLNALHTLLTDVETHGPQAEVWVVDCASTDGTPQAIRERYPQVSLIASDRNLGFAAGNNLALRQLGFGEPAAAETRSVLPRAVYLLNPDTVTLPGATRTLYDALFSLPRAGVVGAQLTYEDGSFQHGAFRFPGLLQLGIELFPAPVRLYDSWLNGRYSRRQYERGVPFRVDHTLGATMMVRGEAIQQAGLLDESYFMYCEEIDWSFRIRRAGWEIYTVPAARVIHLGGQSTGQVRPQSLINLWRSRLRLFDRYFTPQKRYVARRMVRLGMRLRLRGIERAFRQGKLSPADHEALIAAYQTILSL